MEAKIYRVKIIKGDQQFEVEGDQDFVVRMLEHYGFTPQATFNRGVLNLAEEYSDYPSKQVTSLEFIRSLNPKKKSDIALGFAYYLNKYAGKTEFSLADIKNLFYESRFETINLGPIILQHIKRGYIMEARSPNSKTKRIYMITRAGEDYIEKILTSSSS